MKKRAMKKWIPKDTVYCYHNNGQSCKWHKTNLKQTFQENGYCLYLKQGDWQDKDCTLLWDYCKECGIKDDYNEIKEAKHYSRKNLIEERKNKKWKH